MFCASLTDLTPVAWRGFLGSGSCTPSNVTDAPCDTGSVDRPMAVKVFIGTSGAEDSDSQGAVLRYDDERLFSVWYQSTALAWTRSTQENSPSVDLFTGERSAVPALVGTRCSCEIPVQSIACNNGRNRCKALKPCNPESIYHRVADIFGMACDTQKGNMS